MLHQLHINRRKKRRVVPDVVLDDEDRLHAEHAAGVGDVAAILEVLDHRRHQTHVALPEKCALDWRSVGGGELRHLAHVVRERHHRGVDSRLAKSPCQGGRRHVSERGRRDDQVEPRSIARERERGVDAGHMRDSRRMPYVEVEELLQNDFVELAILGEDERVVQARNEQDVMDAEAGEIGETSEAHLVIRNLVI